MKEINIEKLDLELLLQIAEAKSYALPSLLSGHLTLMRFTTHWKIMWGTPNLDSGKGRREVRELTPYKSLKEALFNELSSPEVKHA